MGVKKQGIQIRARQIKSATCGFSFRPLIRKADATEHNVAVRREGEVLHTEDNGRETLDVVIPRRHNDVGIAVDEKTFEAEGGPIALLVHVNLEVGAHDVGGSESKGGKGTVSEAIVDLSLVGIHRLRSRVVGSDMGIRIDLGVAIEHSAALDLVQLGDERLTVVAVHDLWPLRLSWTWIGSPWRVGSARRVRSVAGRRVVDVEVVEKLQAGVAGEVHQGSTTGNDEVGLHKVTILDLALLVLHGIVDEVAVRSARIVGAKQLGSVEQALQIEVNGLGEGLAVGLHQDHLPGVDGDEVAGVAVLREIDRTFHHKHLDVAVRQELKDHRAACDRSSYRSGPDFGTGNLVRHLEHHDAGVEIKRARISTQGEPGVGTQACQGLVREAKLRP